MRIFASCVALAAAVSLAQPCPFDAQVRALGSADGGIDALKEITRTMMKEPVVREWIAAPGKGCTTELHPHVTVLESPSNRCSAAIVELERTATGCKEVNVVVGGAPHRMFALVSADARGKLAATWTFSRPGTPVPAPTATAPFRAECAGSLVASDAGVVIAAANDPGLHFDGCSQRGVPEVDVRREVLGCLDKSGSRDVTLRFYGVDAGEPSCIVSTQQVDDVAVVRSGALEHLGPYIDSPAHFRGSTAYFEIVKGAPKWLCADPGFVTNGVCTSPLIAPVAAREGCRPPKNREAMLLRAVDASCAENHFSLARREVDVGNSSLTRMTLEEGDGITNEVELVSQLKGSAVALSACIAPGALAGVIGKLVVSGSGQVVAVSLPNVGGDEACVAKNFTAPVRAFKGQTKRDARVSIYAFRFR
ncbi:MAG: hypothetical protein QM817_18455 [Archangium sp.]